MSPVRLLPLRVLEVEQVAAKGTLQVQEAAVGAVRCLGQPTLFLPLGQPFISVLVQAGQGPQ
jgi:hypothetical protein